MIWMILISWGALLVGFFLGAMWGSAKERENLSYEYSYDRTSLVGTQAEKLGEWN